MSRHKHRIDYEGAAILVAAAVPLLLGLSWAGTTYPWRSWEVIGCFVFSAVAWVAFVLWEFRAREPVINPRLFENSIFTVSSLASALQSAAMFGAIMFLPLFVQGVQGKSATNSGIILMPLMLGAIVTSIGGGQILARTGRYKALVVFGFAAVIVGAFLLSRLGVGTGWVTLSLDMVVMGLGLGIAMSAFTVIVQNQYPTHRLGEVTAGLQFFRSIGGTVGLAVFGTILNSRFSAALDASLPAPLRGMANGPGGAELDNPQVLVSPEAKARLAERFAKLGPQGEQLFTAFMNAVRDSLAEAIAHLFFLAGFVGVAGLVVVLFLKEVPLRRTHAMESGSEAAAAEPDAPGLAEPAPVADDD